MKGMLARYMPTGLYAWARRLSYLPMDAIDAALGLRDPLTPPRYRAFVYGFDPEFRKTGEEFVGYFRDLAGLKPDETVLDIGCGIGRVAIPLTAYLSAQGRYEGFDAIPDGIRWCRKALTPRFPNFSFQVADIYNATYNPKGTRSAGNYAFPYPDETFDFAWTKSVYTHMYPSDVEHYLSETARVLKPGGRCLNTFFLLNDESRSLLHKGQCGFDFRFEGPGYMAVSDHEPEKAIAFPEEEVREMHKRCGLEIVEPIRYGAWCPRPNPLSGQDLVPARRPRA